MSMDAMSWAFARRGLKPATKVVLLRLSDAHNKHTGYAEISYRYLTEDCEMAKNTVISHMNLLIDMRLIKKCHQTRRNGGHAYNRYLLAFDHPDIGEGGAETELAHSAEIEQGVGAETEQGASAETEQGGGSTSCTRVVQIVEQGKKHLREHSSPPNPPKVGESDFSLIDEFKLGEAFARDIADRAGLPVAFVVGMVPRWQEVMRDAVAQGSRPRSLANNFRNWLTKHPSLKAMRTEWYRANNGDQPPAAKPKVTPETVFETEAGQNALRGGVGSGFLTACQQAKAILDDAVVDRLVDERAGAVVDPDDKAAVMVARATEARETALAEKFLQDDAA